MGRVLVLITQLRNLTPHRVGFRVPHGLHLVRDLPPGRTRIVKQYRILRFCRESGKHWTVGILIDGNYTGIEISSSHLLKYVRIIFRYVENGRGENVLVVEGIEENPNSDYLLRLRYFGWMRNIFWDKRKNQLEIATSDSRVATKLRGIEAPLSQHPQGTARQPLLQRQTASPPAREAKKIARKIPVYYSSSVVGNETNPRTSVSSRMSSDSGNTNNNEKLEQNNIPNPNAMDESRDKFKKNNVDGKLNVNNAVPPPHTRSEERIPSPPLPNINRMLDSPYNYRDDFVNGILFGFAFVFVVFVRVWIG